MPLHIAFIDLTKAFDLISRDSLFSILIKIGRLPFWFKILQAFHKNTYGRVSFNNDISKPFNIKTASSRDVSSFLPSLGFILL